MKDFAISEELGNQVLAYLASRPYQEVHQLVTGMQSLHECDCQKVKESVVSVEKTAKVK